MLGLFDSRRAGFGQLEAGCTTFGLAPTEPGAILMPDLEDLAKFDETSGDCSTDQLQGDATQALVRRSSCIYSGPTVSKCAMLRHPHRQCPASRSAQRLPPKWLHWRNHILYVRRGGPV